MNVICEQSSSSHTFATEGCQADAGTVQEGTKVFSEVAPIKVLPNQPKKDQISITVDLVKENVAIGTARYTGARHLNKNIAIKPNLLPGYAGDLIVHGNIEVHIKVNGKEVPMTSRDLRYWPLKPELGTTTANGRLWRLGDPDPKFVVDGPGAKDAPGSQVHLAESFGQLLEFLAGNPKAGGAYYHQWILMDRDGTSRVRFHNLRPLTPQEFLDATKRKGEPSFTKQNKFLFDVPFPGEADSDSGVIRIPEANKVKPASKSKRVK